MSAASVAPETPGPRLAGVMGWPVAHSRSPLMHGHWLKTLGVQGFYAPLPVRPENLEQALRALPALGFAGCNLTIPHKEAALGLMDRTSPEARAIGAVNCVVVEPDGALVGRNYDGFGFLESLKAGAPGWRAQNGPALVLGAGGAARAVLHALIGAGVREIRLANRSFERAAALAAHFGPAVAALDWNLREEALEGCALLVNTTSLGMAGQPALEIGLDRLAPGGAVCDIVYVPLTTPLLAQARARGHAAVDGLGMLIHQGRPAFRDWFGPLPPADAPLRALLETTL